MNSGIRTLLLMIVFTFAFFGCAHPEKTVMGIPMSIWTQLAPNEQQQIQDAYAQQHQTP